MSTSGPFGPTVTVDDATVGTVAWNNPNNAQVSDAVYATTASAIGAVPVAPISTTSAKLVKAGAFVGTAKTSSPVWPSAAEAYQTLGGSSDLWGAPWTAADINDSGFGAGISGGSLSGNSHYLKCTGFGFAIPLGDTIDGILVEPQVLITSGGGTSRLGNIDYVRITVSHHTPPPNIGNFFLLV